MNIPNFLNRDRNSEDSSREDLESEVPLEASIPLEESVPLESFRKVTSSVAGQQHIVSQPIDLNVERDASPIVASSAAKPSEVVERATIPLLEERVAVDYHRCKIGEIIVRKEIEVRTIQVPVRREKLIVEQIAPEPKELASVVLAETNDDLVRSDFDTDRSTVTGEFASAQEASQFLQAIANYPDLSSQKVLVNLVLAEPRLQEVYQQWLQNYGTNRRSA
jgi:stress response protein YsnF